MDPWVIAIAAGAGVAFLALRGVRQLSAVTGEPGPARRDTAVPSPPAQIASRDFHYYSGLPRDGYVRYTDSVAMQYALNHALLDLAPDAQFERTGFAQGFLAALLARIDEGEDPREADFQADRASDEEAILIGWLGRLQTQGTDNAGPSTRHMRGIVDRVAKELLTTGPYRHAYWSKAKGEARESLAESGLSDEQFAGLSEAMQRARWQGERLAASANRI
ncbi:hypothetical protein HZY97_12885 [Sphingomonas sp. R-74633]|uniref:hypothetical protein n=1 Tax=Sphingomonas sp. R-74633 TaxID=2751188 RepID=UPI0015D130EF|nr:hypothetical protein [Sphingomonas sp. R-74633]NYT41660.1 hypothetical protein [Sphingomonas sp. R-74633]